jgi:hypothetical protein
MIYPRARTWLVWTFIIGLSVQCIAVIVAFTSRAIATSDLTDLLKQLLSIYSIQFAVILGSVFGKSRASQQVKNSESDITLAFRVAFVLSVLWNLMLIWRTFQFGLHAFDPQSSDRTDLLLTYLDAVASSSSFLIAGALAFFFGKSQ